MFINESARYVKKQFDVLFYETKDGKSNVNERPAMISFDKYLEENLKDEEFAKHYEEEKLLQDIAVKIAKIREKKGLT